MAIDEIDIKILKELIKDARISLKEIAEKCGVSSNAIFKRIKQLEDEKVIMGYSLMMSAKAFGLQNFAVIWLTIDLTREIEAMQYLKKNKKFNIFRCIGSYDIIAYYMSNNMQELEDTIYDLKKQEWSKKVLVNIFNENKLSLENVNLKPTTTSIKER